MNRQIVALGRDKYWLQSVQNAMSNETESLQIVDFQSDIQKGIDLLPKPCSKSILLLDVSELKEVEQAIAGIRAIGWKYVITVAADPSAKEAAAVLRRNLCYDY